MAIGDHMAEVDEAGHLPSFAEVALRWTTCHQPTRSSTASSPPPTDRPACTSSVPASSRPRATRSCRGARSTTRHARWELRCRPEDSCPAITSPSSDPRRARSSPSSRAAGWRASPAWCSAAHADGLARRVRGEHAGTHPPRRRQARAHRRHARVVLRGRRGRPAIEPMAAVLPGAPGAPSGERLELPGHDAERLVILQYTSGSTSEPKGS